MARRRWSKDWSLALYILLAGLVTVDVLLKKSDVPRALGLDRAGVADPYFRLPALLSVRDKPGDTARPEDGTADPQAGHAAWFNSAGRLRKHRPAL